MHILIAALGALACWRHLGKSGGEAVRDVQGVIRSGKWNRCVDQRLIENLSDPRAAAAILAFQIAQYDGAVTDRQHTALVDDKARIFGADEETAQGLFAFACMAVGAINDAGNSVRKILPPVVQVCTPAEEASPIALLERTAEIEAHPTEAQRRLIGEVRHLFDNS